MTAIKDVTAQHIVDFLDAHVGTYRRRGKKAEIKTCPFCDGGTHNDQWTCVVFVEREAGNYKCMRGNCNATGSYWNLLEHYGVDPKEYYKRTIAGVLATPSPEPDGMHRLVSTPSTFTFPTAPDRAQLPLTSEAEAYFQMRGLSPDLQSIAPVWCDDRGNINFGYYYRGELCMVKVRVPRKRKEGEPKAWQAWKGGLRPLWTIDEADPANGALVITFGEFDALALKQVGIPNVVSVPNGDNDLEWININWEKLQQFEAITIWADSDKSGQEALYKIADRLGYERLKDVRSPFKDANEHLFNAMKLIADEADAETYKLVKDADWLHRGYLERVGQVIEQEQCFEGYTSGIEPLDKLIGGFFFGQLILHIGKTKQGKSSAVNQITAQAIEQGGKACVWAGEDTPSDYKYKMYVHLAGFEGADKAYSERTHTEYASVKLEWKPRLDAYVMDKLFLVNTRELMNEDILLQSFELAYRRYGCDVFVVDNLMKLVAGKDTDDKWQRQATVVNKLVDFAKSRRVTVHLVCHTNKTGSDSEPPSLRSNAGAQEIANLCDRALFWWRIPEACKGQYAGESMVGVLADRMWGNEGQIVLTYHALVKRYGATNQEILRQYSIDGVQPREVCEDNRYGD